MKDRIKMVANNKKAYHDYFIDEKYEAGIELFGTEVKSVRMGKCSVKEAFVKIENGQVYVYGMHISPYEKGNIFNKDPLRVRKLLLHKAEIMKLNGKVTQKGYTLVPLQVYFKGSLVKVEIGLARGKKLYDKRQDIAKKDMKREVETEEDKAEKARGYKHMTFQEAAVLARDAGVGEMWLTHYSPSLVRPEDYMDGVREIFPQSYPGKDGKSVELNFEEE